MKPGISTLFSLLLASGIHAQIVAVTEYGDEVLLYDDGTWHYIEADTEEPFVVEMEMPPFNGQTLPAGTKTKCRLTLKSSSANNITDDAEWFTKNGLQANTLEVPNPFMRVAGNIPGDVPTEFREHMLVRAISTERNLFLIYGMDFSEGRFLLVMNQESREIRFGFDFSQYQWSPEYEAEDQGFINQRIDWAVIEDDILYVSHSHNTYASSSKGMNAYITAIDLSTNALIWRSKPLVSNATNFVVIDDALVCGYGFTDEKDYLYVLNKHTGNIEQTVPIKSGPSWLIQKNNELFVRTYNTDYVFTIAR